MPHPSTTPRGVVDLLRAAQARDARGARALGRLITVLENRPELAAELPPTDAPRAWTVGLTGPPGVGKSTCASALVRSWRARGQRVAVLAVDPSSARTAGALLGDRLRMTEHATDASVFVRSLATRGALGGLSATTAGVLAAVRLCPFDVVLIETVGVGQSELDVASLADATVVLLAPGIGDGVQAAKAGLMEVADVFGVNQADKPGADRTVTDVGAALAMTENAAVSRRLPQVVKTSAIQPGGVDDLVEALDAVRESGSPDVAVREALTERLMREAIGHLLWRDVGSRPAVRGLVADVAAGKHSLWSAAQRISKTL